MFKFLKKKNPVAPVQTAAKKGVKKMDALVTGAILSGIIASIYGVKKLRERDHKDEDDTHHPSHTHDEESK